MKRVELNLEELIKWLGIEGAIAGLDASELTVVEILELTPNWRPVGHSKMKKRELIQAIIEHKRSELYKKPEELMAMDAESVKKYFFDIKATKKEIQAILDALDVRPQKIARNSLVEFAAREISEIGMYMRVAQGGKSGGNDQELSS